MLKKSVRRRFNLTSTKYCFLFSIFCLFVFGVFFFLGGGCCFCSCSIFALVVMNFTAAAVIICLFAQNYLFL